IRRKPDDVEARVKLGIALSKQDRFAEAEAAFREAIRIKPDYAPAHAHLGHYLQLDDVRDQLRQRRRGEVLTAFREAVRLQPKQATYHYNRGWAYGKWAPAEAAAAFREAIRLQPDDAEAHCALAQTLEGQGKPAEAVAEYREAIRLQPDFKSAYLNLG